MQVETFNTQSILWLPEWLHHPYRTQLDWIKLTLDSKDGRAEFLKNILKCDARWVPPHGSKSFSLILTNHQRGIIDKLIEESARLAHAQAQLASPPPPSKRIYRIDSVREFVVRAVLVSYEREAPEYARTVREQIIEKARAEPKSVSTKLAAYLAEHRPDVLAVGPVGKAARDADRFVDHAVKDAVRKARAPQSVSQVKYSVLNMAAAYGLFPLVVRALNDQQFASTMQQAMRDMVAKLLADKEA